MPYVTIRQQPKYRNVTFEEILFNEVEEPLMITDNETNTLTRFFDKEIELNPNGLSLIPRLKDFVSHYERLYEVERESLYEKFYIPKKSGGLREINAPLPDLKRALYELKDILEGAGALYHTNAFAYIPKRCTVDAIKRHQYNNSNWFLKLDFADFFTNTTLSFMMSSLATIYPFSEIVKSDDGREVLAKALELCTLKGGLPQGTPISPMLTNLVMIPFDFIISKGLRGGYIYTRYADDLIISSRSGFNHEEVSNYIKSVLRQINAQFTIKDSKTRYGSKAGRNWNLGLMLNKDNDITVGYRNKKNLRAMLHNYATDKKNGINWSKTDVQVMSGTISYYKMVEPEYMYHMLKHMSQANGVHLEATITNDLSA